MKRDYIQDYNFKVRKDYLQTLLKAAMINMSDDYAYVTVLIGLIMLRCVCWMCTWANACKLVHHINVISDKMLVLCSQLVSASPRWQKTNLVV